MKPDAYSTINSLPEGDKYFAAILMKDIFLTELLEEDRAEILYFGGRSLARQFASNTLMGIEEFFNKAGWGDLEMSSQKETSQSWVLTGDGLTARFLALEEPTFYLEAGFIAQQITQQLGRNVEAGYQINGQKSVTFDVEIS
ncbi:MAG: YslB family protein [Lactobacillaceae bacterium]|jgi:predicted hydrocarbon binding protein|nr:YslB family protein [Lactobacillaceae bacterium]